MECTASGDLLARARAGDLAAFDSLVGPLIEPAFRLASGMLHDREAAEDAVQDAALRAWRKLGNLRANSEIQPWFLGIVANRCRSLVRGRWWSVLKQERLEGTAGQFEDEVVRGADLRRAILALRPDQRLALVLHYYLDLPLEEVAAITRVPVGTAKSRVHRAVEQLRPRLTAGEVA